MDSDTEEKSYKTLQVGVVGAGISGLCAAIALRRAGHDVEVFERSHFKQEVGAAITITPNAARILRSWNFSSEAAHASQRSRACTVHASTLELISKQDLGTTSDRVEAYHRAHLHNELRHLAKSPGNGAPVSVVLGREVKSVKCRENLITFVRGAPLEKDLIIVADGIRSSILADVIGTDMPPQNVGRSVYRTLVPFERISKEIFHIFERFGWSSIDTPFNLRGTRCDIYPCTIAKTVSIAIYHTSKPHEYGKNDWHCPATIHDVLEVLHGMHPFFSDLVKSADHFNCYMVALKEPVPTMANCCTAIIGDAAHAMQPLHAQGACMCVEDAAALEVMFRDFTPRDSVELRLKLFSQLRVPRISVAVLFSNGMYYQAEPQRWLARLRNFYDGDLPSKLEPWTSQVQLFFWQYDAYKEAEKALKYTRRISGLPRGVIEHFGQLSLEQQAT